MGLLLGELLVAPLDASEMPVKSEPVSINGLPLGSGLVAVAITGWVMDWNWVPGS